MTAEFLHELDFMSDSTYGGGAAARKDVLRKEGNARASIARMYISRLAEETSAQMLPCGQAPKGKPERRRDWP